MTAALAKGRPFLKMHGLGNDFLVLDGRERPVALPDPAVRALADRRTGVGFDQLILVAPATDERADAFMGVRNSDGGEVEACGNGARCLAWLLMREAGRDHVTLETRAGLIEAWSAKGRDGTDSVTVDMGRPRLGWRDIPLAREADTLHLPLAAPGVADPVGVSMGNPHAVFFVSDADSIDVARIGPGLERDPLFPERANIEFAQLRARDSIRMRVWERGAGITSACGSGACATLVAAVRRGLADRAADLLLDGGPLRIEWRADDHVLMTGPVALAYSGTLPAGLLP